MTTKQDSCEARILLRLLQGERMTSKSVNEVHPGQYYCNIKNSGVELVEMRVQPKNYKIRWLKRTPENIERAKKLFERLTGRKAPDVESED